MKKADFDISIIVTAHEEGRLAHRTMRSIFRAVNYASKERIKSEILVIIDKPDKDTIDYFAGYHEAELRAINADFGDPGLARNLGVKSSSGKYVAFIDADNLFSEDWLYKAFRYLEDNSNKDIVVHPEYHIVFESKNFIWRQLSSDNPNCHLENLLEVNYWDTVCVTGRTTLLKYPYGITTGGQGFGFEDWHFNCETLADGIEHHVVPETVHFLRVKKRGSQNMNNVQSNRLIRPTKLFEPLRLSSMLKKKEKERIDIERGKDSGSLSHRMYRLMHATVQRNAITLNRFLNFSPRLHRLALSLWQTVDSLARPSRLLPAWLIEEWKDIHAIEPLLFPEKRLILNTPYFYCVPDSRIGRPYVELCSQFGEDISHVFLVPWLKRGGADLEAINYIKALAENNLARNIIAISTTIEDSPWAERLPRKVRFIEFGKLYAYLNPDEQEKLLARLLLQTAPKTVHNINSDLGYRVFVKYGKALKSISALYASTFCKDVTEEGKAVGYPFMYLPECFDDLTAVSSDNASFLKSLQDIYAFDGEKLFVHYQPISPVEKKKTGVAKEKRDMDILWAGRLDRQKRPDILLGIADACMGLPVRFHVYGTALLDTDIYMKRLKKLDNVTYHGAYDGFLSLPTEEYDLFLYTSQWDGLPNVLLESMSVGLPVVASGVGGVGELVIDGKTGFIIEPFDDVDAYVSRLKNICGNRTSLKSMVDNAYELIKYRHSPEKFLEDIKRFPGYVST